MTHTLEDLFDPKILVPNVDYCGPSIGPIPPFPRTTFSLPKITYPSFPTSQRKLRRNMWGETFLFCYCYFIIHQFLPIYQFIKSRLLINIFILQGDSLIHDVRHLQLQRHLCNNCSRSRHHNHNQQPQPPSQHHHNNHINNRHGSPFIPHR